MTGLWRFESEQDKVGSCHHRAYSPVRIMMISSAITRVPQDQGADYFLLVGLTPAV